MIDIYAQKRFAQSTYRAKSYFCATFCATRIKSCLSICKSPQVLALKNDKGAKWDFWRWLHVSREQFLSLRNCFYPSHPVEAIATGVDMWFAAASGFRLWHIAIMATVISVAMLILVGKLEQKVPSDKSEPCWTLCL
ncbi:hypothetical protein [Brucella grignonensis]|nr:hypothetical protein [Brucella grignonensis]